MKGKFSTIFIACILMAGLSLLLYPTVSDWWNSLHQSRAVDGYTEIVEEMDPVECARLKEEAVRYNDKLFMSEYYSLSLPTAEAKAEYRKTLNVTDWGMMAYIEVPKIDCRLPVCHGVDEGTLQNAVGHIEGSSLPVGGINTHCIISGHTGLTRSELFTNLEKMAVGDIFMLHCLGETLTYEVDQVVVALPSEINYLFIQEGKDLCTLMTCTPYGVNSHRLLVRGKRIANLPDEVVEEIPVEVEKIDERLVKILSIVVGVAVLFALILIFTKKKKKKK